MSPANWTFCSCICGVLWQHSGGASVTQSVGHFPLSFGQKQIKFKRPRPPQRPTLSAAQRCAWMRARGQILCKLGSAGGSDACWTAGGRPWTSRRHLHLNWRACFQKIIILACNIAFEYCAHTRDRPATYLERETFNALAPRRFAVNQTERRSIFMQNELLS